MKTKKKSKPAEKATPPAPKKRFRIEKLEERIAPRKSGGSGTGSGLSTPHSVTYY